MASEYDQFDQRDDFDDQPRVDPARIVAAKRRTAVPGMFLVVFGLIGLGLAITGLVLAQVNPSISYDQYRKLVSDFVPDPAEKAKVLKQLDDGKDDMMLNSPTNMATTCIGGTLCLFMVIGGLSMRRLGSYGLSLTGAICGLIPISSCCCFAMPFGLWAVIVLANSDVRDAFRMAKRT